MAATVNAITYWLAWVIVVWHVTAIVAGAVIMTWEHFTRPPAPTADEISFGADTYQTRYGKAAFRQIGEDMYRERTVNGSGPHYRYLREVSGELVRRLDCDETVAMPAVRPRRQDRRIFRADSPDGGRYAEPQRKLWPRRG